MSIDPAELSRLLKDIQKRLARLESAVFPPAPTDIRERAQWLADQLDGHLAKKAGRPDWEPQIDGTVVMALFDLQAALPNLVEVQQLSLGPCSTDDVVRRVVSAMRGMSATGDDLNPTDWTILRHLASQGDGAYISLKDLRFRLARSGIRASDGTLRSRLPALVNRAYLSKRKRGKGGGGYCMTPKAWWTLRAAATPSIKTK